MLYEEATQRYSTICLEEEDKGTCDRSHVGTVIIGLSYCITARGHNTAPGSMPTCDEIGHEMVEGHCVRTIHAEINAIAQAARRGVITDGGIMFVSYVPCLNCAKAIIQAGITEVYARTIRYEEGYNLLTKAGIPIYDWEGKPFDLNKPKE